MLYYLLLFLMITVAMSIMATPVIATAIPASNGAILFSVFTDG